MRRMLVATVFAMLAASSSSWAQDAKTFLVGKTVSFGEARSLPYVTTDQVAFENVLVDGDHYLVVMRFKNEKNAAKFEPVSYRKLRTARIAPVPNDSIVIDGDSSDWVGILPVVSDPANDLIDPMYATTPGTDLAELFIAHDDVYLYFRMTFHNGDPLPNAAYWAEFQQFLYQMNTPGDVSAECYNIGGTGWAVALKDRNGRSMPGYPPGSGYCAAGTGLLEWKAPIEALRSASPLMPYFPAAPVDNGIENRFVRAYIHPIGGGPPSDENDAMRRPLIIDFYE